MSIHELGHLYYFDLLAKSPTDKDSDYVSDKDEFTLEGIKSDPNDPDTFKIALKFSPSSGYSKYGDNEIRCRKREVTLRPKLYPEKDWANPGCQNKNQYGPIPK